MTICPHCGKDSGALEVMPAKVKNLTVTSWCVTCGKAKSYSCLPVFGNVQDDPDAVEAPEMCHCPMFPAAGGWNSWNYSEFITV